MQFKGESDMDSSNGQQSGDEVNTPDVALSGIIRHLGEVLGEFFQESTKGEFKND